MLESVYKSYKKLADQIEWKKYNCNDLFFKYIEHEHDELSEKFFAGIVCRYWGYSGKLYVQCNRHVTFEQCYDTLIDTINYVLEKRVWEKPESSLYQDKAGPDKAFHMVLKRQRSILLANLNAYKRKSNFNTLSIDGAHEEYADSADGLLFDLPDSDTHQELYFDISNYFHKEDYLNGLFMDIICFGDYQPSEVGFNTSKIVSLCKKLTMDDYFYYSYFYDVDKIKFRDILREIGQLSTDFLILKLKQLLYILKEGGCYGN